VPETQVFCGFIIKLLFFIAKARKILDFRFKHRDLNYGSTKNRPRAVYFSPSEVLPSDRYGLKSLQNGGSVSEENRFAFQFSMSASVDELRAIVELEGILKDCTGTRDAVARCCVAFRDSGRFEGTISFCKLGSLVGVDAKTAWCH
jgi:hypothetical protein